MPTINIEFKLQDLWIGAFWKREGNVQNIWTCLVPCFPMHISWEIVKLGQYQHFKGQDYQVFGVIHHTKTEEPLVVYGKETMEWGRPVGNFKERLVRDGRKIFICRKKCASKAN